MKEKLFTTKNVVLMGMLGALAGVLMMFEVPLVFLAPSFYGLDFSEVPVLVGSFALGPVAGIVIEAVKILVKLVIKPTSTGFVGEFANFAVGCALVVPAGLIYRINRTKKGATIGMAVGTILMAAAGVVLNALVMLPFYSHFMPLDTIISMGAQINPAVSNVWTFALFCVGPFNVVKGIVVSLITALVYKRVSVVIHGAGDQMRRGVRA
ncbi:ECF transporter S component [Brotaphodocola sp.]|uniref:ECF transporter S component n=1 Tax=Brotaphodocola sp. TaxID=3073577 RepID=UPI003D7E6054